VASSKAIRAPAQHTASLRERAGFHDYAASRVARRVGLQCDRAHADLLPRCVASEAFESGDDVVRLGIGELPQEHFGEFHFARPRALPA
jgi:hypothetical protein